MIVYTLDTFIAALREAARAVEQLVAYRKSEPAPRQHVCVPGSQETPVLFDLFSPTEVRVSQLRIDIPIWIERPLMSERVAFRACTKSRWRRKRNYKLSIELGGNDLSHATVSLDDQPFRNGRLQ